MPRVVVGDFRTGRRLLDVPFSQCSWERRRNTAEQITATVPITDIDVRAQGYRSAATAGKAFLAIVEGDNIMGAGPIWRRTYDQDAGTLDLNAAGIWSWADKRTMSRLTALTADPSTFLVPDPANPGQTVPNPLLRWAVAGLSRGTIVKRIVQQLTAFSGGDVPIVLPADIGGTHELGFDGIDFKPAGEAITELTQAEGGPDVEFTPRWTPNRDGVQWLLRTGTEDAPLLQAAAVHRWDMSVVEPSARNLNIVEDASNLASIAWVTGGRADDTAVAARATSRALTDAGYPLFETVDTSHGSVTEQATLDMYATEIVRRNAQPGELWTFEVRKDQAPRLGEYNIGDACIVKIGGDPYLPDGEYRREIAGLSGDEGPWVKVTTAEVYGG